MPKRGSARARASQCDHVKAVLVAGTAMTEDPGPRQMFDHSPFPPGNRFLAGTESRRSPHLHLDERHQRAPPHHQIDIMMAEGEAMGFQAPAPPLQPFSGKELSLPAVAVAGIGPLIDGNAIGRHGEHDGDRCSGSGDPVNAKRSQRVRQRSEA